MGEACPNCGATLHCGCQKRVASDGSLCCDGCIQGYEQKLITTKANLPNG
jgi:hypothetical protein